MENVENKSIELILYKEKERGKQNYRINSLGGVENVENKTIELIL